jgi:hypothetical protein
MLILDSLIQKLRGAPPVPITQSDRELLEVIGKLVSLTRDLTETLSNTDFEIIPNKR